MATNTDVFVEIGNDESTPLLNGREEHVNNFEATEQYLQELYRTECDYKISQEDVDGIQNFTESCVHNLIRPIVESFEIVNAYDETRLLKVGSSYDGTKNALPDEFDYILVLAESNGSVDIRAKKQLEKLSDKFHKRLKRSVENCNQPELPFQYIRLHGPASKLALYISANAKVKIVSIDISVACKFRLQNDFRRDLNVRFNDWGHIIESTGSFLLMKKYQRRIPKTTTSVRLTITDSEKHYMLTSMSEKHKKVYRLLKLLMNGNEANEELRHLVRQLPNRRACNRIVKSLHKCMARPHIEFDFPSYAIKCVVFVHVQCCKNETSRVTDCIIQVLGTVLKRLQTELDFVSAMNFFTFCKYNSFSVCVEQVYGDFLRVVDEFGKATDIADVVSDMIIELTTFTEIGHEHRQTTVLSSRRVGYIKKVLKKQKVPLLSKSCFYFWFLTVYITLFYLFNLMFTSIIINHNGEAHPSRRSVFDLGIDSIECVSSKQTNSYSLPCKRYFCLPENQVTDLKETKKKLLLNCDTTVTSTSIALFADSSNGCDVLCTPRSTTNRTEVSQKAGQVKRCCLLTAGNDDFPYASSISVIIGFNFGLFFILLVIFYIPHMAKKWKQRQHYRKVRGKITATLNSLKERGLISQ